MNCHEFQLTVHDLWRRQSRDAALRRAALDHAGSCARCRRLLAAARSLSTGLRLLAEGSESEQAPPKVEAALLESFKQETRLARARRGPPRWELMRWALARWVLAAAAALVLMVGVLGVRSWLSHRPVIQAKHGQSSGPAAPKEGAGESQPNLQTATLGREGITPSSAQGRGSSHTSERTSPAEVARTTNFTTDFVPLSGVQDPLDFEEAEVVRVSLPRSALADLGLPVSEDSGATTINAEVLIAEDGTARAIRFQP